MPELALLHKQNSKPFRMPNSFAAVVTVLSPSDSQFARSGQIVLHVVSGPSGATLLGRFCHGDQDLLKLVREYVRMEERTVPDAVFAEITFLPFGRAGNVVARPLLRDYEIPIFGRSGCPPERQIPISDLHVWVDDAHVRLWSQNLGREVIPRLSCAHTPTGHTPVLYRFLHELQFQGDLSGLVWDWGPFEGSGFLPRVTVENVILSRAQWSMRTAEISDLVSGHGASQHRRIQSWRKRRKVPRFVAYVDEERELLVDFDNVLSVDSLIEIIKKKQHALLREVPETPNRCSVSGPEGGFCHEVILPFVSNVIDNEYDLGFEGLTQASWQNFIPGSEWLYAKIYTAQQHENALIADVLGPLASRLSKNGTVDRWFFIRYADPDEHVRVRFHGNPEKITNVVADLNAVLLPGLQSGTIFRLTFDTYQREMRRYGGSIGIELAERMFHFDSEAAVDLLMAQRLHYNEDNSWRVPVLAIDAMFGDFGFDLGERLKIAHLVSEGLGAEFSQTKEVLGQLSYKFRSIRNSMERLVRDETLEDDPIRACLVHIKQRSLRNGLIAKAFWSEFEAGRLGCSMLDLVASFVHMTLKSAAYFEPSRARVCVAHVSLPHLSVASGAGGHFSPIHAADASIAVTFNLPARPYIG